MWTWILLGAGLLTSTLLAPNPLLGKSIDYIEIKPSTAYIYPSANTTTTSPSYYTQKSFIFELLDTKNGASQVRLFDQSLGWIKTEDTIPYPNTAPPVVLIGICYPIVPELPPLDDMPNPPSKASPMMNNYTLSPPELFVGPLPDATKRATRDIVINPILAKPLIIDRYSVYSDEMVVFPKQPPSKYPDLEVNGFYEAKLSARDYSPKTVTGSIWETIRNDPVYTKLPADVLVGPARFDIRYKFNIDGLVGEDLSVHYDVEQEPDFPGKYDIKVKHKNSELTFFHFDTDFKDGELINLHKALDGVKGYTKTDQWEAQIAMGKERSEPKEFLSYGNGTKVINLGANNILEDSLKVWVNNQLLQLNKDYTVDYFQGQLTFKDVKIQTDVIKVIYEFTNPIADFIPILNRKNFLGAQFLWKASPEIKETAITQEGAEDLWPSKDYPSANASVPNLRFDLKHSAIVRESETVYLNDGKLRRNQDYFMKYQKGKLLLQNIVLQKTDQLKVTYKYYETQEIQDKFIAKNSPGPYILSRKNIIDGSAKVAVNSLAMDEVRDYIVDYDQGKLYFNYPIPYPQVITIRYTAVNNNVATASAKESPLNVGVTYLNEYVHSQPEQLILTATSQNYTAAAGTNVFTITGNYTPLTATKDIVMIVRVNNTTVSSDFKINNLYTGEIELIGPNTADTKAVEISFKYRKSFLTTQVFQGNDAKTVGFWYVNGEPGFELHDVPMRYQGIDYVQIYDRVTKAPIRLANGIDYIIQYGPTGAEPNGINIQLQFLEQTGGNSGVLNDQNYPNSTTPITLHYYYTPQNSLDQGDVNQSEIGVTMKTKLSPFWNASAEVVGAENNFAQEQLQGTANFNGNGQANYSYSIGIQNLVENSELVFIKNGLTTRLLNKGSDYFINYTAGTIRFQNMTPGTLDQMSMEFKYYGKGGQLKAGNSTPLKLATKLGTTYDTEKVSLKANLTYVDKDFKPLAPIQDPVGSLTYGGDATFRFDPINQMNVNFLQRNELRGKNDINQDTYFHQYDLKGNSKWQAFKIFDTQQSIRYLREFQDPSTTQATTNLYAIDNVALSYTGEVQTGPPWLRESIKRSYTRSIGNWGNPDAKTDGHSEAVEYGINFFKPDVGPIGLLDIRPFYREDLNSTFITANEQSHDNRHSVGIRSKWTPWAGAGGETLSTEVSLDKTERRSGSIGVPTENVSDVENQFYKVDYAPFGWVKTSYDKTLAEEESPLINQQARVERTSNFRVTQLSPAGALMQVGARASDLWVIPLKNSNLSGYTGDSSIYENNNQIKTDRQRKNLTLTRLQLFPGFSLNTSSYDKELTTRTSTIETSISTKDISSRDYSKKMLNLTLTPPLPFFSLFTYNYNTEDKHETNTTERDASSMTQNITSQTTPHYLRTQSLAFAPGNILLPLWLFKLPLGSYSTSLEETWDNSVDTKTSTDYGSDFSTPLGQTVVQNNAYKHAYTLKATASPFGLIAWDGLITTANEYYSRNIDPSSTGTTIKSNLIGKATGKISPFSFWTLSGSYTRDRVTQYQSTTINMTEESIKDAQNTASPLFQDFLHKVIQDTGINSVYYPFNFLSINTGLSQRTVDQTYTTLNAQVSNILQQTGTLGAALHLFSSLDIGYDLSMKRNYSNSVYLGNGFNGKTTVSYIPFSSKTFSVIMTYVRVDTWGKDTNELDQATTLQGTGTAISTQISDQSNFVETGSLSINITVPITNSPYVQSFVLTGEGQLKKVWDRLDPEKDESAGQRKNSYEISGLVLKGTLNF